MNILKTLEDSLAVNSLETILQINKNLDHYFNITPKKFESNNPELYCDLELEALSTSYTDYYQVLKDIGSHEKIIDLGAGLGRGSLLSAALNLPVCISLELVDERIGALQKALIKMEREELGIKFDLALESLPESENFYLYFPVGKTFYHILRQLLQRHVRLYVCEAHGDTLDFLSLYKDSLKQISSIKLKMPRHHNYIEVYETSALKTQDFGVADFAYWFLNHFDSEKILKAKWFSPQLHLWAFLYLPIKNFDLILYHGEMSLLNRVTNRIYKLGAEITLELQTLECIDAEVCRILTSGQKVFSIDTDLFREDKIQGTTKLDSFSPERVFKVVS